MIKKIFKKIKLQNFFILNFILALIILILSLNFVSCKLAPRFEEVSSSKAMETSTSSESEAGIEDNSQGETEKSIQSDNSESSQDTKPAANNASEDRIVYFELTSDPLSNHFEHRVLNIYSVLTDGSDKKLIYSDINEKYDLGPVFSISPNKEKIACKFVEGGRGAYSALAVIDIESKNIKILKEYDYTGSDEYINIVDLYGEPIWTQDSKYLIFESIKDAHSSNTRDVGIFKVNVDTGEQNEIKLDVMGASLRSTLFLAPLFVFDEGKKLAAVFHPYYPVEEERKIIDFYTVNEGLSYIDISSGKVNEMFDKSIFEGLQGAPEIISSFNNFLYLPGQGKVIFQVLGDFEEDGDIWISDLSGQNLKRLTTNPALREQQPDVYGVASQNPLITYIGSNRYGTISSQIPSGDVYITDSSGGNSKKLTDYGIGAFKPMFSDDGKKIGYLRAVYDENFENITKYILESVDIASGDVSVAASANYMDFIGWINK